MNNKGGFADLVQSKSVSTIYIYIYIIYQNGIISRNQHILEDLYKDVMLTEAMYNVVVNEI